MGLGYNFRASVPFVGDGVGEACVLPNGFEGTYPTNLPNGSVGGWEAPLVGQDGYDESNSVDARVAGTHQPRNETDTLTYRIDTSATGSLTMRAAHGDAVYGSGDQYWELLDNNTSLGVTVDQIAGTGNGQFYDIAGNLHTNAANWVTNNSSITRTFATSILRYRCVGRSSGRSTINHFWWEAAGGGGTSVTVSASSLSGSFSIPSPQVSIGSNVNVSLTSGSFSIPSPTVSISVSLQASVLSGSFSVPNPSIAYGATVTVPPLSGSYNLSIPALSLGATLSLGILSGSYSLPNPSIATDGNVVVSIGVISGSYSFEQPSFEGGSSVSVQAQLLSGTYTLPGISVAGNAVVSMSILSASYGLQNPSLSLGSSVPLPVISGSYSLPSPSSQGSALVQVSVLSASLSLGSPSMSLGVSVAVPSLSGAYSIGQTSISSDYGVMVQVGILSAAFSLVEASLSVSNNSRSLRERIIEALEYNLRQITTGAGYNYDMGEVLSTPKAISQLKSFPAANIFLEPEEVLDLLPGGHSIGYLHCKIPVHIDFYLDSYSNPKVARENLLADVERRIMNNQCLPNSNGDATVSETRLQDNLFFGTNVNSPLIGLSLTLNLYYHQLITDPTRME